MDCERCRARDGRTTNTYELVAKHQERKLCDPCAEITRGVHELKIKAAPAVAKTAEPPSEPPAKKTTTKNQED